MRTFPLRKIALPNLPPTMLHRASLCNTLEEVLRDPAATNQTNTYKLILLCAPAGYGKTTLLADFAHHSSLSCCWFFLDSSDSDVVTFIERLIISIRHIFPHFGSSLDEQLMQFISTDIITPMDIHQLDIFTDNFSAAIDADIPERFVIFLCNYHEINENEFINAFVNRLLHYLPQQCTFVIESRAIPSLELASLLVQHQMFGIGSDSLSFTRQDIRDLSHLQQVEPLSEEEIEQLATSFGGWITGILLGTRLGDAQLLSSGQRTNTRWGAPAMHMDRQMLFAYLIDNVFKHEPEVYQFLKDASILQQMTVPVCNELLSIEDAETRLAYIEQKGLFVTHNSSDLQTIYICHPVLHELLYTELKRQDPGRAAALHRRAADIFRSADDYEQAITHALAAEANDFAADLIIEISRRMLLRGYSATIGRWIDMLPASTVAHSPQLLLARANIYLMRHEVEQAQPLLENAHRLVTGDMPAIDHDLVPVVLAEILIARGIAIFGSGDYLQTQQLCQDALQLLPADERELRAVAHHRLGICASMLGDCTQGIVQMQQALQLWGHQMGGRRIANLHGSLANAYSMIGNYALSEHHRARAIAIHERLGDVRGKIDNQIWMAILKRNRGSFSEAETMLKEVLKVARAVQFQSGEAYTLLNLGETYLDQGLLYESLSMTEDGLVLARQLADRYLMNLLLYILSMTYALIGDFATALLLVDQIITSDDKNYESTLRELTRGTIFLLQQRYQEADTVLRIVVQTLENANLKRLHVRALIRFAACQIALEHRVEAIQAMEKVVVQIAQGDHESIALIELHRLPQLWEAIQSMPPTARLRSWPSETPPPPQSAVDDECKHASEASETIHIADKKTSLQVQAFGEPTVIIDGMPITRWRMARSVELYFFLLDYGRPIHKERIIAALWPDADDRIDQTLRSTIYYLRKSIGESCVVYRAGAYALDHTTLYGENIDYDIAAFLELHTKAKEALMAGDDAAAKVLLHRMIELYRGDYVQSFYSDLCSMRRDELRSMHMDAHQELALIFWREEQFDESMHHWQNLLAVDNCLEDAHYGLMSCYIRQGKRGLALRQYQRCVDILQEELSVSPGPAIQKLHQRLIGNN